MPRGSRLLRVGFVLALGALGVLAACSDDDDRPPPTEGSANTGGPSIPTTNDGGRSDSGDAQAEASEAGLDAGACAPRTQAGAEVAYLTTEDPLPAFTGGAIPDGTWILKRAFDHVAGDGGVDTGKAVRASLYFEGGNRVTFIESRGNKGALAADATRAYSYTLVGSTLSLVGICPTSGATEAKSYTFDGAKLLVASGLTTHDEYELAP